MPIHQDLLTNGRTHEHDDNEEYQKAADHFPSRWCQAKQYGMKAAPLTKHGDATGPIHGLVRHRGLRQRIMNAFRALR